MAALNVVHVPYRGSAPAAVDLIAGQAQLALNNIVPTLPHVKSGRLRALGVSGPLRSPVLPEVPTVAESGLPGYEAMLWLLERLVDYFPDRFVDILDILRGTLDGVALVYVISCGVRQPDFPLFVLPRQRFEWEIQPG